MAVPAFHLVRPLIFAASVMQLKPTAGSRLRTCCHQLRAFDTVAELLLRGLDERAKSAFYIFFDSLLNLENTHVSITIRILIQC